MMPLLRRDTRCQAKPVLTKPYYFCIAWNTERHEEHTQITKLTILNNLNNLFRTQTPPEIIYPK